MPTSFPGPLRAGSFLLALVVAGCSGGPSGSSGTAGGATDPPSATPAASAVQSPPASPLATASSTPRSSIVAVPPAPPAASLAADGGDPVPGDLGSYTWRGGGSDAPWIIVPARRAARSGPPYRIDLDPPLVPVTWRVVWAPIENGLAGQIQGHEQGTGTGIMLTGPRGPGPWSLRLEVDFGPAGRATWYWRLAPAT